MWPSIVHICVLHRGIDLPPPIGFCIDVSDRCTELEFRKLLLKQLQMSSIIITKYNSIKCISLHHIINYYYKIVYCINEIAI